MASATPARHQPTRTQGMSTQPRPPHASKRSLWLQLVPAATSGVIATIATHPIDTVKLRLQLRRGSMQRGPGFAATFARVARADGVAALWRGLVPSVLTTAVSSTTRLGLYAPLRAALAEYAGGAAPSLRDMLAASLAAGALGSLLANPFHLVKVRMQHDGARTYRGFAHAVACIVRADGLPALWTGTLPSTLRGALFSASQLATYDHCKGVIKRGAGLDEGLAAHVGAAMTAGVVTTTASTPADVVKSVVMHSARRVHPLQCAREILVAEGVRGLMRGWTANYARLGPHTLINMVAYEKVRTMMGWENL